MSIPRRISWPTVAMVVAVALAVEAGGCRRKPPSIETTRAEFNAIMPQLRAALAAAAAELSDHDAGRVHGFEGDLTLTSISSNLNPPYGAFTIQRYYETGRQVGSGPDKQTEFTKVRGVQTLVLQREEKAGTFSLLNKSFAGEQQHKPLGPYTDSGSITNAKASAIPQQDELLKLAVEKLNSSAEANKR